MQLKRVYPTTWGNGVTLGGKQLYLLLVFMGLTFSLYAQQRTITGAVRDKDGSLAGVSIRVKGSTQGTTTDENGHFQLTIPKDTLLICSYIGYENLEVATIGKRDLQLLLLPASDANLEEVVVVGYGTKTRANLTGAVSSISGAELAKSPATNLSSAVAGQVPGVIANSRSGEPGNDNAEIFVRGKSTLGSSGALVVIDGIPDRAGGFNRLNPEDIESFTVIKDASAAIYGARSANGVILITTKRGKSGAPSLSVGTNWAMTQPTRVPKLLNSYQFAQATNEYDDLLGQQRTWTSEELENFRSGTDPLAYPNANWWDAVMKTWSGQQNHIVSLRGGTEKVSYFLSGQHQKQDGMYRENAAYYKQDQGRANIDVQVTNDFKLSADVSYREEFRNAAKPGYDAGGIFRELWLAYPYLVPRYPNGLIGVGIGGGPDNSMLYVTSGEAGYQRFTNDYLQTKLSFNWQLDRVTKGLSLLGYYAYDKTLSKTKSFTKSPPPAYRYDASTNDYVAVRSTITPSLFEERGDITQRLVHLRLGYTRSFGDHNVEGFLAFENFKGVTDIINASRNNFLSNSLDQLLAGSLIGQQNNSNAAQAARVNYISRLSYNYKGKYLLDYTMRYDGSQNFPAGKRFGFFPGVSAGWRISQEGFFHSDWVNDLKLRGSWGKTGNDAISAFNYLQTYLLGTGYGYSFGQSPEQVQTLVLGPTPNPNITWELANSFDAGLEAQLFNGKLTVNTDYFRSMRSNILITRNESVPGYTGLTLPDENLGKVLSRGVEVEVTHQNKIGEEFSYNIRGNMTLAKNKVIFMDEAADIPSYQRKTGLPIDSWLVYRTAGIYQNQTEIDNSPHPAGTGVGDIRYMDINEDGQITDLDRVRLPLTRMPELMFGLSLGASWKGLDMTVFFQGQARAQSYLIPAGLNMAEEFFEGRWQQEGDHTYPRNFNGPTGRTFGVNTLSSDFWLRDASFVRLKNVELGFTFPKGALSKLHVQTARIYVSGSNLLSFDHFGPSFDPENPSDSGQQYPIQRVLNIGANLTF